MIFEPITLTWNGRDYVIPADRVMQAIAKIEDVITLLELRQYGEKGTAPLGKLAMAYAAILRFAGANARDDEVYGALFSNDESQTRIMDAIDTLLKMMLPPAAFKSQGKQKPETDAPSSGKRTKQR